MSSKYLFFCIIFNLFHIPFLVLRLTANWYQNLKIILFYEKLVKRTSRSSSTLKSPWSANPMTKRPWSMTVAHLTFRNWVGNDDKSDNSRTTNASLRGNPERQNRSRSSFNATTHFSAS